MMDIDHDGHTNIVPFAPRKPAAPKEAWNYFPVVAATASNDWEKGFQAGLRMAATGGARIVGDNASEALEILRRIDARLNVLEG